MRGVAGVPVGPCVGASVGEGVAVGEGLAVDAAVEELLGLGVGAALGEVWAWRSLELNQAPAHAREYREYPCVPSEFPLRNRRVPGEHR